MRKSFTLVELMIVVMIIGILAAIGLTQYYKVVEKSRVSEAKMILGTLRDAEVAEMHDNNSYQPVSGLGVGAPDGTCVNTHFFSYACDAITGACTATRCTTGGKFPQGTIGWTKSLDIPGSWTGSAGY